MSISVRLEPVLLDPSYPVAYHSIPSVLRSPVPPQANLTSGSPAGSTSREGRLDSEGSLLVAFRGSSHRERRGLWWVSGRLRREGDRFAHATANLTSPFEGGGRVEEPGLRTSSDVCQSAHLREKREVFLRPLQTVRLPNADGNGHVDMRPVSRKGRLISWSRWTSASWIKRLVASSANRSASCRLPASSRLAR